MSEFDEHRAVPGMQAQKPSEPPTPEATPTPTSTSTSTSSAGEGVPTEEGIVTVIKTCYDPEIPVDIYELGLIYAVKIDPATNAVKVEMTLTSPNCPAAQSLPAEVEQKVKAAPFVTGASVEVVWEPPWTQDRMSEAAKLALGMY